jgi:RNAse (barnase) inhibitor barstar
MKQGSLRSYFVVVAYTLISFAGCQGYKLRSRKYLTVNREDHNNLQTMKIYKIDGKKVQNLEAFYDQVDNQMVPGGVQWERNMDSFNNDVLGGSMEGFDIVWENADSSQQNLGEERFRKILEIIRDHGPDGEKSKDNVHLHLN